MKSKILKKSLPNSRQYQKRASSKSNGNRLPEPNGLKANGSDKFLAFKVNSGLKQSRKLASFKSLTPDVSLYRRLIKKKKYSTAKSIICDAVVSKLTPEEEDPSKREKALKKKLKAHLNAIQENIMNPKKSAEEKMAAIGKLMLMATRFKKHPFEFGSLFGWVKEKHGKERLAEIKALTTDKLPAPETNSKRKSKDVAIQIKAKAPKPFSSQSARRVFTADEKFKLSIGERLYKIREIVPVEKAKLTNLNVLDTLKPPLKSNPNEKRSAPNSKINKKAIQKDPKIKPGIKKPQKKARIALPKRKAAAKKAPQTIRRVSQRIAKRTIRGKPHRK